MTPISSTFPSLPFLQSSLATCGAPTTSASCRLTGSPEPWSAYSAFRCEYADQTSHLLRRPLPRTLQPVRQLVRLPAQPKAQAQRHVEDGDCWRCLFLALLWRHAALDAELEDERGLPPGQPHLHQSGACAGESPADLANDRLSSPTLHARQKTSARSSRSRPDKFAPRWTSSAHLLSNSFTEGFTCRLRTICSLACHGTTCARRVCSSRTFAASRT